MSNANLPVYVLEQLDNIAKVTGFTEHRFELDDGSNHGDGFLGTLIKVTLTGQRIVDGDPIKTDQLNLICKMLPPSQAQRDLFCSDIAFEREVYMYNRILPLLAKFQAEKGLTEANGFFEYPHCYYAISDAKRNQHLIIMDDLRPSGYALWDKHVPIEYDNVRLLMTALGRFNALSYTVRDQRPELFAVFKSSLEEIVLQILEKSTGITDLFNDNLDMSLRLFEGLPEWEHLKGSRTTWADEFKMDLGEQISNRFSVVGHGDCWNNNFMFLNRKNKAVNICILDWQISRLGSPALDLSNFFMTSTTKELRDKHLDEFLQIYYTELAATLRTCGSDPDKLFTFANLQDELKRYGRFGVSIAIFALVTIVSKPENINKMDSVAEQVDGEQKAMATLDRTTKALYIKRVSDVINDAKAYGWL